jgi:hypothetical protein
MRRGDRAATRSDGMAYWSAQPSLRSFKYLDELGSSVDCQLPLFQVLRNCIESS